MGSELPDDINLPPFIWQKKSRNKHRTPGSGSGKSAGQTGALAIGVLVAGVSFVLTPVIYIIVQHLS